jgi:recombination associated protein RdgC
MWFSQVITYQYQCSNDLNNDCNLEELLSQEALRPCPPHARFIFGWMPLNNTQQFTQTISGCTYICFGKEERILPRGVIKLQLEERVQQLETQRGQSIKRAEKMQIAEDLEFELLPKAFCLQKRLFALIDHVNNRLMINTSSAAHATQLVALLRKSVPGIQLEPISFPEKAAYHFAEWITNPAILTNNLQLASDCILFSPNDEQKRLHCKGYELPSEEILTLIAQGLIVSEISLVWNDRIQFTLTDEFTLKRVKCLDYLLDEFNEVRTSLDDEAQQQDAALTLLSGELRSLVNDVLTSIPSKESQPSNKVLA